MNSDLEKMAEEIRAKFKECARIALWGELMVAPGEWIFRLESVQYIAPDRLLLRLDDGELPIRELEVWNPRGLNIDHLGTLTIEQASRIRFGINAWNAESIEKRQAVYLG